jgi:hypothetical protein
MEKHPEYEPWGILIERDTDQVAQAIFTRAVAPVFDTLRLLFPCSCDAK